MARDYAKRANQRDKKTNKKKASAVRGKSKSKRGKSDRPIPWKAILLLVVVIFMIAVGFSILSRYGKGSQHRSLRSLGAIVVTATPVNLHQLKTKRTLLVIPPVVFSFVNASKQNQSPHVSAYMLQLGTYTKRSSGIDLLKAKLLANQFNAREVKAFRAGKAWYRVQMGPYKTQAAAQKMQQDLSKKGIAGVVRPIVLENE